ncbi:MAG: transcription termination factor NusA [Mycoplasmoidaceae bacterium]
MGIKKNFFDLLNEVSKSKNIAIEKVEEYLALAIEKAYYKENPDNKIKIDINSKENKFDILEIKTIVEDAKSEELDEDIEITLSEAHKIKKNSKVGDILEIPLNISDWERIIAIHIKQVFGQKLNESTNAKIYEDWIDKIGMNIRAEIDSIKPFHVEVNLGDQIKGVVQRKDQIPGEMFTPGDKSIFYIKNVEQTTKTWPIILSRGDAGLVENLLRSNIPEIEEGIIEIKAIARIPGSKTKVAVKSNSPDVDPIGTCVGQMGSRIKEIMKSVNNEYIDIILWDDDPRQFLVNACAPEKILGLEISNDDDSTDGKHKFVTIVVNDESLPKVIGRKGMNIKLISKLTHWSIDIQSLTIAKEDKIQYEDVSHLSPTRFNRNASWQKSVRSYDDRNNSNNNRNRNKGPNRSGGYNNDFSFINTKSNKWDSPKSTYNSPTYDITDEDIDELLSFNSPPQKTKPINIDLDDKNNPDGSKASNFKFKKKKPKKDSHEEGNIFDEFDDITKDSLKSDEPENDHIDLAHLEVDEE